MIAGPDTAARRVAHDGRVEHLARAVSGAHAYEDVVDALIRCRVLRRVRVGVVPGEAKLTRMGHLEGVEQVKTVTVQCVQAADE